MDIEELLKEESSVTIHNNAIVEGTVISVNENEIILNIRYKADGILTKSEYSNNPDVDLTKEVYNNFIYKEDLFQWKTIMKVKLNMKLKVILI